MRIVSIVVASALLLALEPAAAQTAPNCTGACTVLITMSAGCGSGIKVAPDPIVVAAGATAEINWSIASPGWAFDVNGITIQQPGRAFDRGSAGGGTKVTLKNKNERASAYKYDVNLIDAEKRKCKLDPTIVNQ